MHILSTNYLSIVGLLEFVACASAISASMHTLVVLALSLAQADCNHDNRTCTCNNCSWLGRVICNYRKCDCSALAIIAIIRKSVASVFLSVTLDMIV